MTYAAPTATLPDHPQVSCTPCKAAQAGRLRWCHGNKDSYDAWGKRRNTSGHDSTCGALTSATTRGYTDQEMIDPICDVNLNARIYDSTLGRMMSPDPTVPNPFNGQSYNRYSYVNNGPTYATDPTGYYPPGNNGPCGTGSNLKCPPYDGSNPSGTGSNLGVADTWDDSNPGALLSSGALGNAFADEAVPGFCTNSNCSPGVSTEFSGGTSLSSSDSSLDGSEPSYSANGLIGSIDVNEIPQTMDCTGLCSSPVPNGANGGFQNAAYPAPISNSGGWLTYNPYVGDSSGGRWFAVGGKTLHIYVNNSNVLGLHGWEGDYTAFPVDQYGNVTPLVCSSQGCETSIGALMPPMTNYTFSYQANVPSPSGLYLWVVNLGEAVNITADNQIEFQFTVSVASARPGGH